MTDTDGVLAAIDSACDDWAVSGDAMRWTPEPPDEVQLEEYAAELVGLYVHASALGAASGAYLQDGALYIAGVRVRWIGVSRRWLNLMATVPW